MESVFILMIGGAVGAITTFTLQKYGCSAVVASCIVGLVGALIGHYLKSTHLPIIIFAGSFVGMTSISIGSFPLMLLSGLLTGVIYNFSLKVFAGFGGRLGTIAFISTVIVYYLLATVQRIFGTK